MLKNVQQRHFGHYAKVCKSEKSVKEVQAEVQKEEESMYNINLFRIGTTEYFKVPQPPRYSPS